MRSESMLCARRLCFRQTGRCKASALLSSPAHLQARIARTLVRVVTHVAPPPPPPRAQVRRLEMLPSAAAAASSSLAEVMTQYPTDMDVDADDSLALLDAHDTPAEKVDADFFNGAHPWRNLPPCVEKRDLSPTPRGVLAQTLRTTSTTRMSSEPL